MATTILNRLNSLQDNPTFQKTPVSKTFYTTKLLNWVEPIEIAGKQKTVFYSELNNNFNIGDRVYILNGNYDTDEFIKINKYSRYTDGYRVLGRDGTRIILDIDYTGISPYNQSGKDDFIRVHHIRTQREFDYINSIKIALNPMSVIDDFGSTRQVNQFSGVDSKFTGQKIQLGSLTTNLTAVLYTNTIIYATRAFASSANNHNQNSGVPTSGFYIKTGTTWVNINTEFYSGRIKNAIGNYQQNSKIYIVGEDFENNNLYFRQRNAYEFINGTWTIDIKSKQPFISKLNFRHGKFSGKHNDGIFGTSKVRNKWISAEWNSGAMINSEWYSGSMNSKSTTGEKTIYSVLATTGSRPTETIDFTNNKGFGYNYIEDTNFISGSIFNGNFNNCNIGYPSTFSATNNYFGSNVEFGTKINGKFELCNIDSVTSNFSTVINCNINNSNLKESTIINSQLINTTADNSTVSDKNSIKILAADLWSRELVTGIPIGILKLYISDIDLDRLEFSNSFYIYRTNKEYFLNSLDEDKKILLPYETKYILDLYFDSESEDVISVSLKTKNDNKLKTTALLQQNSFRDQISRGLYNMASIDIEATKFSFFIENGREVQDQDYVLTPINTRNVNTFFKDVDISNSDFKSGYLNNSLWQNSANLNYYHHRIKKSGSNLNIFPYTNTIIKVYIELNPYNRNITFKGEDLSVGDLVWLNSITQTLPSGQKISLNGRYKVLQINTLPSEKEILIESQEGQSFSPGGFFRVDDAEYSNYASINKFRINNSTINKGFFKRTSITNSKFINVDFNTQDRDLTQSNIKQLKLINIIFKDTNNIINSGLLYKSHFINDTWNNGMVFNSIWNKGIFKDGLFNNSYWQDGIFNGGNFINSRELIQTTQDYNSEPVYRNWLDGTFNSGEFSNSYWMKGTFNNGKLYNSEWFSGVWNNGILGSNNLSYNLTKMGVSAPTALSTQSTIWNNGVVENALIGGEGVVNWYGGKFLNGEMTDNPSISSSTIWYDGDFLGGKITGYVSWKNGNFYKGKFASILGWDQHNPIVALPPPIGSWGWENGKFYGGEFGNGTTQSNSVWFNGEFKGGIFMGRYWNNGVFSKGEFRGSLTSSIYSSPKSPNSEQQAVQQFNDFISPYYGFWRNGIVSDTPNKFTELQTLSLDVKRKSDTRTENNTVLFRNTLWGNGTFSHKNATIQSSIWLNGNFFDGTFDSSIFNAFVHRTGQTEPSFSTSSVWHNGTFDSTVGTGSFYYSEWKKGVFQKGYMSGAIWRDGIWNYGTAENIYWENGLWRNGNWNGSPFNLSNLSNFRIPTQNGYEVVGRAKDLILNVRRNIYSDQLHLNNVVTTTTGPEILEEVDITSFAAPTSSFFSLTPGFYATGSANSSWILGQTFSTGSSIISRTHILTTGGNPQPITVTRSPGYNWTNPSSINYNIPTSDIIAARDETTLGQDVFTTQNKSYEVKVRLVVELAPSVSVKFQLGVNEINIDFNSNAEIISGSTSIYNYWSKQYDVTLTYVTPNRALLAEEKTFLISKIGVGLLRILGASIKEKSSSYDIYHNNTIEVGIFGNDIFLPSQISPIGSSDAGGIISVNYGNGLFKSGVWENGIWNDGYRSNRLYGTNGLVNRVPDYYRFTNVIGFNGIRPFGGKNSYQVDGNSWLLTLKGLDPIGGLSVGDKISIGNIVLIDINDNRKLLTDYTFISQVDITNNTITANIISDFPIRRIERDSENHLIYVSKNIWLSGAFLNGYFSGIWNNGLFKGYPLITLMEHTHWIDGKFDGGTFRSIQRTDTFTNTIFNTGLIQKFIFIDNFVGLNGNKKFLSWMDINYQIYNFTQLNETVTVFDYNPLIDVQSLDVRPLDVSPGLEYFKNEVFKDGAITYDVLESSSIFSERISNKKRRYSLGTKFKKYENFVPKDGNFKEPFSNDLGNLVNLDNFYEDEWDYIELLSGVTFSQVTQPGGETWIIPSDPIRISSNTSQTNSSKLQIYNRYNTSPNVIIYNHNGTELNHIRISGIRLNNRNFSFLPNRYYISEVDLSSYTFSTPVYPTRPYASNINGNLATQSHTVSLELIETFQDGYINELKNPNPIKTQYFFNRVEMSILLKNSSYAQYTNAQRMSTIGALSPPSPDNTFDFRFNNISFYEVDMIPFFKYFQNEYDIDFRVKSPFYAVAPFIDYNNANFNYLENVRLTIDGDEILGQSVITQIVGVSGGNGSYVSSDPTSTGSSQTGNFFDL